MATSSGYPGNKSKKIGGTSLARVRHEAAVAANQSTEAHEGSSDPHVQYTTDAEVEALIPRFVTYWKWS